MKPFFINRNSWHYKLNSTFFQEHGRWGMQGWKASHNSFCSYWRATMFRVLFASILALLVLWLVTLLGLAIYLEPAKSALGFGAVVALFTSVFGVFFIYDRVTKYANKAEKSESLAAQRYRVYKSKICPVVEFKN